MTDFHIFNEEKERILSLHKTATRNHYILNEQMVTQNKIDLPIFFKSGYHSVNAVDPKGNPVDEQIRNNIIKIEDFIKKNPNSTIEVTVESSESAVPNKDNESGGVTLPPGELSKKRAATITNILTEILNTLKSKNRIGKVPKINQPIIKIGKERIPGPKADAEQYVKVTLTSNNNIDDCLVGIEIIVDYQQEWCKPPHDTKRCHKCDEALFTLFANGVPIKLKGSDTDSLINLNNAEDGGSRIVVLQIQKTDVPQIVSRSKEIHIQIRCESTKCHDDALHLTIKNKDGVELMEPTFIDISEQTDKPSKKMNNGSVREILVLDRCGKFLRKNLVDVKVI